MICAPCHDLQLEPRMTIRRPWTPRVGLPPSTVQRTLRRVADHPEPASQLDAIDEDPERWDGLS